MHKMNHVLTELMVWLEGNMASQSELHFDSEGQIDSAQVYQALAMQLSTLRPCEALKQHLALSHALLAQTMHLLRIHRPDDAVQPRLITLIERSASNGVFVSPSTHPEPYREFHYYIDASNTLRALMVMDEQDRIIDAYLHPELYANPEVFALCSYQTREKTW